MARKDKTTNAVAYVRTSSPTNVGEDKDSEKRQRAAIEAFASRARFDVVEWFSDPGVKGEDPIETRPGFGQLLDRIEGNGVRVVLIEDASRFARQLLTQELGIVTMITRGVRVFAANGDELTATDDPMKIAMRQIAGTFAQLEKARLVAKLKAARDRKRAEAGKCEGAKSIFERDPRVVAAAKALVAPGQKKRSLREIAAELEAQGFGSRKGTRFAPGVVAAMLKVSAAQVKRAR
jgi:DNA invertase Pin-like site-specific DNA recombinase